MEIIGAGFPRTGTTSTRAALERLGFGPCYHMAEILMNPDHVERWLPVLSGPLDWGKVLDGYRSALDWPASHFWREQAAAYPTAKIILTVRDPHSWFRSFRLLMSGPSSISTDNPEDLPPSAAEALGALQRLRPVMEMIGRSYFGPEWRFQQDMTDEDAAVAAFERHNAVVRDTVPAERLLVFDVRQGWEPLCSFLGVEVPDEPFPHLNDGESLRQAFADLAAGNPLRLPTDQGH